ncbi:uncharacterized protein N7515_000405 [Penicillium bovifimosum]|uniref:CFEM domain-containing protein n=1 Tax=Penicillium bovifimosum TaxID=126998 RepID=A0A9W9LBE6_9EURO|nr:uncharacterized protein N7515_000405 [Penicillium bovifimosum]KAJ5145841.1 hypothetical protein N7515_000405 [Penicillium bovifimosum]
MKGIALLSLLSVGTLAHPAGLWWGTDVCYTSPDNTDNQCSDAQAKGFDWSELANGDNWSFEGFNFVGLEPKNNCHGPGRQGNCIGGVLSSDDDWKIKISAADAPFSIRNFYLSTSRNTDVFIIYEMPDGSTCHHVASSSYKGTDVANDQCGGATSVEFTLPEENKFGDCELEIYSIDFDCSTGTKPPAPPMSDPPHTHHEHSHTSVVSEIHSTTSDPYTPTHPVSDPPHTHHEHIPTATVPLPHTHTSVVSEIHSTTSRPLVATTVWVTEEITVTKCAPTVTNCPGHSTVVVTSTKPSEPLVTAPCPDVVPKCLNTWLDIPKCDSNSDAACFCPSSQFTDKVSSCIRAWSSNKEQQDSALAYFAGICAPYVPANPSIITIVPTPTPDPRTTGVIRTVTVDVPTAPHSTPCTTITWSSHTATVPQVGFSTVTCSSTTSVGLVLVTPTSTRCPSSHSVHISSTKMSTRCSSPTSSVAAVTVPTTTATKPTHTWTPVATPTETVIHANAGAKMPLSGFWALGLTLLAIVF